MQHLLEKMNLDFTHEDGILIPLGNTYNVKNKLKELGFVWNGITKQWSVVTDVDVSIAKVAKDNYVLNSVPFDILTEMCKGRDYKGTQREFGKHKWGEKVYKVLDWAIGKTSEFPIQYQDGSILMIHSREEDVQLTEAFCNFMHYAESWGFGWDVYMQVFEPAEYHRQMYDGYY